MQYLTTHDLVWINASVTGYTSPYNYITLEAAMASQYSYGSSDDVVAQASGLLAKLISTSPFNAGNLRTALIATLTFLEANGCSLALSDDESANMIQQVAAGKTDASVAVKAMVGEGGGVVSGAISLRKLITHECNAHMKALSLLAAAD